MQLSRIALFTILLAGACGALAAPGARSLWSGASGGFDWRVSATDITGARSGSGRGPVSLKRRLGIAGKGKRGNPDLEGLSVYEVKVRPLSLVGSLLCYRRDDYWEGGAHPSGDLSYASVDLADPKRTVRLTDLFPDPDVTEALWNDPVVRKALKDAGVTTRPATAAALVKRLEGRTFGGDEGFQYGFPREMLSGFGFHHLEGDQVAVRIGIPWGAEIFRFQGTELGILLPIPSKLREPLRRAAAGQEGFLARSLPRALRGREITLVSDARH